MSEVKLMLGDCLELMKELPDGCVDCCVTSPPYDNLRTYNGYSWDFEGIARELYRITKPGGVVCWNVGDAVVDGSETLTSFRQALYFKDVCGFRMHDTMIYEKASVSNPESVRYYQIFEYVFILSKGSPKCFNPLRDKPNRCLKSFGKRTRRMPDGSMKEVAAYTCGAYGIRGNVWRCKTASQEQPCKPIEHPAVMPYGLCRDLILSWSNPGDTVLDPFAGSGTTGVACVKTGRNFIGMEIDPEYFKIAEKRIHDAQQQPNLLEVA